MDAARSLVAVARAAIEAAESSVAPTAAAAAVGLSNEANDFVSLATTTAENFRRRRRHRDITIEGLMCKKINFIIKHTIQFKVFHYKTEVGTWQFREALKKLMHNNAKIIFIVICLIFWFKCVTLYLRYLNDDSIHYNLDAYAT